MGEENETTTTARPVALVALLAEREGRPHILLGRKLRGFGQGKIVLPGGKVEPGESAADAAIREFFEETGLKVGTAELALAAQIKFRFTVMPDADMDCTAFIAHSTSGHMRISDELEPLWVPVDQLPVDRMWQDSGMWLPQLAAGQRFTATIVLDTDNVSVRSIDFEAWD